MLRALRWIFFLLLGIAALFVVAVSTAERVIEPERLVQILSQRLDGELRGEAQLVIWPRPQLSLRNAQYQSRAGDLSFTAQRLAVPLRWRDFAHFSPERLQLEGGAIQLGWPEESAPLAAFANWQAIDVALRDMRLEWRDWEPLPLAFTARSGTLSLNVRQLRLVAEQRPSRAIEAEIICRPRSCSLFALWREAKQDGGAGSWRIDGQLDSNSRQLSADLEVTGLALPLGSIAPAAPLESLNAKLRSDEALHFDALSAQWADGTLLSGAATRRVTAAGGADWQANLALSCLAAPDLSQAALALPGEQGSVSLVLGDLLWRDERFRNVAVEAVWDPNSWQASVMSQSPTLSVTAALIGLRETAGLSLNSSLRSTLDGGAWLLERLPLWPLLLGPATAPQGAWEAQLTADFSGEQRRWDTIHINAQESGELLIEALTQDANQIRVGQILAEDWQPIAALDSQDLRQLAQAVTETVPASQGQIRSPQGQLVWQWDGESLQLRDIHASLTGWSIRGNAAWQRGAEALELAELALDLEPESELNLDPSLSAEDGRTAALPFDWLSALTPVAVEPLQHLLGAPPTSARLRSELRAGERRWSFDAQTDARRIALDAAWQRDGSRLRLDSFYWSRDLSGQRLQLRGSGEGDVSALGVNAEFSLGAGPDAAQGRVQFSLPLDASQWRISDLADFSGVMQPALASQRFAALGLPDLQTETEIAQNWELQAAAESLRLRSADGGLELDWGPERLQVNSAVPLHLSRPRWSPLLPGQQLDLRAERLTAFPGNIGVIKEAKLQIDAQGRLLMEGQLDATGQLRVSGSIEPAEEGSQSRFDAEITRPLAEVFPAFAPIAAVSRAQYRDFAWEEGPGYPQLHQLEALDIRLRRATLAEVLRSFAPPRFADLQAWQSLLDWLEDETQLPEVALHETGLELALERDLSGAWVASLIGAVEGFSLEGRLRMEADGGLQGTLSLGDASANTVPLVALILRGTLNDPQLRIFGRGLRE